MGNVETRSRSCKPCEHRAAATTAYCAVNQFNRPTVVVHRWRKQGCTCERKGAADLSIYRIIFALISPKLLFQKNAAIVNEIRKRQLDFSTSYEWWRQHRSMTRGADNDDDDSDKRKRPGGNEILYRNEESRNRGNDTFFFKIKRKKKDGRMKSVTQRRGDVLQGGSEILFKGEKQGKANLVGRFVTPKALRIMLLDVSTVISVIRASSILSTLIVGG